MLVTRTHRLALQVLFRSPTPALASLPTSLALIGSLTRLLAGTQAGLLGSRMNLPHRAVSKHLGAMGRMSDAFAPIVRARPLPIFGRPVHLRDRSHRLRPNASPQALRIPDRSGHPALQSAISGGFRSVLAVSSFRLRARLDVSIPSSRFGRRGITPAFGYGAPHPSAGGTSTLLTHALPSAHYGGV